MLPKDRPILFLKTHVRGYTRGDGTYVAPHEDSRKKQYDVEAPRKRYTDDRQLDLFIDAGPDPSQAGPGAEAAQRAAVDAVRDLRSTETLLGLSLSRDYAARQRVTLVGQKVETPEDLAVLAQVYRDPRFETLRLFFTDSDGKVVSQVGLTSRLPASAPGIMGDDANAFFAELMFNAKETGATGFYMMHNHPSGVATASRADCNLTAFYAKEAADRGMKFHGHVVIDTNEYSVIDAKGEPEKFHREFPQPEPLEAHEWEGYAIDGPDAVMKLAKCLYIDKDAVTLIQLTNQHHVKTITTVPAKALKVKKDRMITVMRRASLASHAPRIVAVGRDKNLLIKMGVGLLDAIHIRPDGQVESLHSVGGMHASLYPNYRKVRVSPDTSEAFAYLRDVPQKLPHLQRKAAEPMAKASSIPEGARWITVHPNGPGSEGQPVLIQPNPDGSAHVIGGAGGKLNYLKLRHVRRESEYKKEAEERKKAKAEEAKAQRQRDKEAGILESKNKAKQDLRNQQRAHERDFVSTVAQSMGWDPKEVEFPEQDYAHLSEAAQAKLRDKHHRTVLQRALQAVDLQRQRLVTDQASRMEAGISEVPLEAKDPETISVQDLVPIADNPGGLGFSQDFKGRAEAAGLSEDELKAEADKAKAEKQASMTDAQRLAAVKRGETAKLVQQELKGIREPAAPDAKKTVADARQAVDLLKAAKRLKEVQRKAREAAAAIDKSAAEPKAFVLEYTASPDEDAKITEDLNNDLRTAQTMAFLSEFKRLAGDKPEETLGKHIGIGAYNSINSLALAVGGEALVDRSVVDVLGIAGAAQILSRRIHTDMGEDAERVVEGVQDFHLHHYMETSREALAQAQELMDAAREVELGEAANGADLQVAQELNSRRRKAVGDAQKIIGQALGEMEANAALVTALKQGAKEQWQGSLGKIGVEDAIRRVRALGLQRGDYTLETVAGDTFLTINAAGMDRLAKPINREDIQQIQRNLAIIRGDHDEDGWLPMGVANRPDLVMDVKPGVAPRLAEPFQPGEDLQQSLRDYIGGRAADGDPPADIVADIQSAQFFEKVGFDRAEQYRAALDAVAPLKSESGKMQRAEALESKFNAYADEFVQRRHGGERQPLHRQKFDVDQKSVDALHRALSKHPEGVAAFKPLGELTSQDQRALREFFYRNVAKESPEQGALRTELERLSASEPERETTDMFGETTTNPEWDDWKSRRDELSAKVNAAGLDWPKYIEAMHGHEKAYEAIQDLIRSNVGRTFAENYNKLNPAKPLKLGKTVIRNNLNHLDATDPAAREERMRRERELVDSLRERVQGRYASGAVSDKLDDARAQNEAFEQAQMGFFSTEEAPAPEEASAPKLAGDERHSLGHAAERQIAGMMSVVGRNFKPGQPTKLWAPTMSGGKNAPRQRLVKMVDANKRVMAAFGTGSGKSLLQLASFTHLHQQGKAKRGLFLVPSIVQGQFSGEALRYLEPGKFNWHIEPGASREERIKAYKNPEHHFCVMTHQSFRDDMIHLGARHEGISEAEMSDRLGSMSEADRNGWMKSIMEREGINFDYLTTDESQYTLNRQGKENSDLANVVDALSAHTPYYVAASGDPVKNDASEVFDLLHKMDPGRYSDRSAFLRRYGADTLASKDALKREMARYVYPSRIDPDVKANRVESRVQLSDGQRQALQELDGHFTRARIARMEGRVDVDAMKAISPSSFDDVPEGGHEAVAKTLQQSLGIMKASAIQRVINTHPDNPVVDDVVKKAAERKGKPGVVFAHNREAVRMLSERLEKEGHRVVVITGSDSGKEKERKRLMFNPEQGEAQADILVASDAGATGMNIQRGQWLYQFDTPQTAMTHAQRNGRIFRTGQKNDVELIDGIADHPEVHKARDRLQRKYGLRELMTSPMEGLDDTGVAHFIRARGVAQQDSNTSLF